MGAKDFLIGGDLNVELKLEGGGKEPQGLGILDWHGLYFTALHAQEVVRTWRPTRKTSMVTIIERTQLRGDEFLCDLSRPWSISYATRMEEERSKEAD